MLGLPPLGLLARLVTLVIGSITLVVASFGGVKSVPVDTCAWQRRTPALGISGLPIS